MTTCITAPTLGIILGGFLDTKMKSKDSKLNICLCIVLAVCALGFSVPIPLTDNIYIFSVLLWLVLFCGAAIMPILTGIIITSVPRDLRANGNSLSSFFSNLIGYLPAPFVYGFLSKYYKNVHPKLALSVTLFSCSIGIIFLILSFYFKSKIVTSKGLQINDKILEFKNSNEISRHTSYLASIWGNTHFEEEYNGPENRVEEECESDTSSRISGNKLKFVYEEKSRENSIVIQGKFVKQTSCKVIYDLSLNM